MEIAKSSLQAASAKIDEVEILRRRGYFLRGLIGEGSYSKVRRAYSTQISDDVAVKIIVRNKAPEIFRQKFLPREIEILSFVRHPHIIKVFEIFETRRRPDGDTVYIVTEFVKCGDLLEFVKEKGAMAEPDARYVLHDVIDAATYLHSNKIAHRDIKCENILLDVCPGRQGLAFTAKLCDFGFARKIPKGSEETRTGDPSIELTRTFCGSAAYAAPEVLQREAHNPRAADVWAIGVVCFITLYGAMPYDDTDIGAMVEIQRRDEVPVSKRKISRKARDLIKTALRYEPNERPKVAELLKRHWFHTDLNKQKR